MYAKGTILVLNEQREPDPETGEKFPYNRVEVIGESPITKDREGFTGADAKGVLLRALTNFGGNLDEPFGKCRQMFKVESIPDTEVVVEQKIKVVDAHTAEAGPTPEEIFADEAPGTPPEEGQKRARTNMSPLGPAPTPEGQSPLDAPPKAAPPVTVPEVEPSETSAEPVTVE